MTARTRRGGPPIPMDGSKPGDTPTPPRNGAAVTFHGPPHHRHHARLRGRIKIAAFRRGVTTSEMLRELFEREFPDTQETP